MNGKQGRFEFGKNWIKLLTVLNEGRIIAAQRALLQTLELDTLAGKAFLDIGSGSGRSSLAANRLGAMIHSFDFDHDSVVCTAELKCRYFPVISSRQLSKSRFSTQKLPGVPGQSSTSSTHGVCCTTPALRGKRSRTPRNV